MRKFKMIPAIMAAAMVASMGMPVFAADPIGTNTAVAGETVNFDKYLVLKEQANVPNQTFNYTITPGAAIGATGEALQVLAGIGTPTVGSATFSPADVGATAAKTDDNVKLAAGEKYVDKTVAIDFTGIQYTEPGIYRYVLQESAVDTENGFSIVDGDTRYLDVYIESDNVGALSWAGVVMHMDTSIINIEKGQYDSGDKRTGFTNKYTTYDLTLKKNVTGNQADRSKYFDFTVDITDAVPGTVYTVALPTKFNHADNPATLTADNSGHVQATYHLKDNQEIVIKGLTAKTKYNITEVIDPTLGYSTTIDNNGTALAKNTLTTGVTAMGNDADNTVAVTNAKNGIIPTGIIMEMWPYAAMLGMAGAGFVVVSKKRKKDEE